AIANIDEIVQLTNIGTLFAFVLVALGIIILRRTNPNQPRPFRTPWVPLVPIAAIVSCAYLMFKLTLETWVRFVVSLAMRPVLYSLKGLQHGESPTHAGTGDRLPGEASNG